MGIDHETTHHDTDPQGTVYQPVDGATLVEIVSFIWPILFGNEIEPGPTTPIEHCLSASISIGGLWTATLVVTLDADLAARSAASLLDLDVADLDEEVLRDAVGEIANVVGGNVKGLLDDNGESTLSLPVVARSDQTIAGGHVTIRTGFDVGGSPMVWKLYERVAAPRIG